MQQDKQRRAIIDEFERFEKHYTPIFDLLSQASPEDARALRIEYLSLQKQVRGTYVDLHMKKLKGLEDSKLTKFTRPALIELPPVQTGRIKITLDEPKDEEGPNFNNSCFIVWQKGGKPQENDILFEGCTLRVKFHYAIAQNVSFNPATGEVSLARKRNDGMLVYTRRKLGDPELNIDLRIGFALKKAPTIKHLAQIGEFAVAFATVEALYMVKDYRQDQYIMTSEESKEGKIKISLKPNLPNTWQINEIVGGMPFIAGQGFIVVPTIKDKKLSLFFPSFKAGSEITKEVDLLRAAPQGDAVGDLPSMLGYIDVHSFKKDPASSRKQFLFVLAPDLNTILSFSVNTSTHQASDAKETKFDPPTGFQAVTLFVSDHGQKVYVLMRDSGSQLYIKGYQVTSFETDLVLSLDDKLDIMIPKLNGGIDPSSKFANQFAFGVIESHKRLNYFVFVNSQNKMISGSKAIGEPAVKAESKLSQIVQLDEELEKSMFKESKLRQYGYVHRVYSHLGISKTQQLVGVMVQTPNWGPNKEEMDKEDGTKNKDEGTKKKNEADGTQYFSTLFTIAPRF